MVFYFLWVVCFILIRCLVLRDRFLYLCIHFSMLLFNINSESLILWDVSPVLSNE